MSDTTDIREPETASQVTRRDFTRILGVSALGVGLTACVDGDDGYDAQPTTGSSMSAGAMTEAVQTQATQSQLTPRAAVERLREGNTRFVSGERMNRDLLAQVRGTSGGQYPFAVVLGCIDSRVPVEMIFDQGVGDIFTARVAGNVVNGDLLGSMEFACNLAGSKAVVVLGHTSCGAVKGAISEARLGNLTGLVQKIERAVEAVGGERDVNDSSYVDEVAETNVRMVLDQIRSDSPVLADMESQGTVAMVGAMYDVSTGDVHFL